MSRAAFPLRYGGWKLRMARNLVVERREYLLLALGATSLTLGGLAGIWLFGSKALAELLLKHPPAEVFRVLSLAAFALYVGFAFMALANVVSRFFGSARMEEREQLMGPLQPATLFLTELLDALRVPGLVAGLGVLGPLGLGLARASFPWWLTLLTLLDLLALLAQPTLVVMAAYIAILRLVPARWVGRRLLLFLVFLLLALLGASALSAIRDTFQSQEAWSMAFPSSWVASVPSSFLNADLKGCLHRSLQTWLLSGSLLAITWVLYVYAFLPALERFGVHAGFEQQGREAREPRLVAWFLNRQDPAVAALIRKDLRSAARDTASRVAFTALAAVIGALVLVDMIMGQMNANIFLPVFTFYALFLIACQGLSTFSAEGGVLEGLAWLPLEAPQLLRAKLLSHSLLFARVELFALGLVIVAPSPIPVIFRVVLAGLGLFLVPPSALLFAFLTVSLGAIFPQPGEGGGRKEISIFAMGLFFQLLTLLTLSLVVATAIPGFFGTPGTVAALLILLTWIGVFRFLRGSAVRAVERALGAELRG